MRRREFLGALSGAAATWSVPVRGREPAIRMIGFLGSESPELFAELVQAFRKGLSETGAIEGRNVAIEFRWATGQYDRLPALAADLVRLQVSVIVANGTAAVAAKAATTTIPIVFFSGADPIKRGFVASLNRPGGNLTGVSSLNAELGPKRLELLHGLIPSVSTIALLVNPTNPNAEVLSRSRDMEVAARPLGLQLHILRASTERDFEPAFASLVRLRIGGLVISSDAFFTSRREQLAALALRHAVPTIYQNREFASAGGLMSYGGSDADAYRVMGVYAGRILKGEQAADLPVQQATKTELIINLKTATALGVTVPLPLLGRADEVIE
jgi:putative tryptophan/tyrosine transport system substrate-binding protein